MITSELLKSLFPSTPSRLRDRFIEPLNKFCPAYGIDNYLRIAAFLACGGVETDFLKTLSEYASGADYEGRADLGNTQTGDGRKYKGRGFFQTTGRFNYGRLNKTIGAKYGIDFLAQPDALTDINIAVESACIFWKENNLAKYADAGDFKNFNSVVNCGHASRQPNQWAKRNLLYSLCKRRIPTDFSFSAPVPLIATTEASQPQPAAQTETLTEQPPTTFKEIGTLVFLHTPKDTIQNIFVVVGARILGGLTVIWGLGLHGKIFLVLSAIIASAAIAYACLRYAPRLLDWSKKALDYVFN